MKLKLSRRKVILFGGLFWVLQWGVIKILQNTVASWSPVYKEHIYPKINHFSLSVSSIFPFSIGDVLYLSLLSFAFFQLWKSFKIRRYFIEKMLPTWVWITAVLHFWFHLSWGLHYFIPTQMQFSSSEEPYQAEELYDFSLELLKRAETLHQRLTNSDSLAYNPKKTPKELYSDAFESWEMLSKDSTTVFKSIPKKSTKTSIFSLLLSYMGYSGYFNPFTHEAQVNAHIPTYNKPTTILHEMSHQTGVADEGEANWLGYKASVLSPHEYIQYSGYTYALKYCMRNLYQLDETLAEQLKSNISKGIWANFMETEAFFIKYDSPLEIISKHFYDIFLKYNQQTDGILGYNRLVDALLNEPLPEFQYNL